MSLPDVRRCRIATQSVACGTFLISLLVGVGSHLGAQTERVETPFGTLIVQLSEPGGYFDTDNLISNESSYLHVIGGLRTYGNTGGAYLGVGPDQNYSYLAVVRPAIAYMIDIRRDNLLEHLLFKSVFALSSDRGEYLSLLLGRPAPRGETAGFTIETLLEHFDRAAPLPNRAHAMRSRVRERILTFGVPLSAADLETIDRIHQAFIQAGLGLRFESFGRASQSFYPTYRQLLLERDLTGSPASYLTSEGVWNVVRTLHAEDRIVPVVGNLAGDHALHAIAADIRRRGLFVSAFYTSNVEYYLMGDGSFGRFIENVRDLPVDDRSLIIRSYFGRGFQARHPDAVPGYATTQILHPIRVLLAEIDRGGIQRYADLLTKGILAPR